MIKPVEFIGKNGKPFDGYNAEIIPEVCDIYLSARNAGSLAQKQLPVVHASEMLVRSLAKVGITALLQEQAAF